MTHISSRLYKCTGHTHNQSACFLVVLAALKAPETKQRHEVSAILAAAKEISVVDAAAAAVFTIKDEQPVAPMASS